jgi:hypothetical protein
MDYLSKINTIISTIEELQENPEFLSKLTSESEISLDEALELFCSIEDMVTPTLEKEIDDPIRWRFEQDKENEIDSAN